MKPQLSILEFLVTVTLVVIIVATCYNYLGRELVGMVEQAFSALPRN